MKSDFRFDHKDRWAGGRNVEVENSCGVLLVEDDDQPVDRGDDVQRRHQEKGRPDSGF